MKTSSLNHCRSILQTANQWYKTKRNRLSDDQVQSLEKQMLSLESAINANDTPEASRKADLLEAYSKENFKKSIFDYTKEFLIAILIALVLAVVVRQMWFEPYVIPTGSMRPTFREQDHVTVSKTAFGLNIPMTTGHFLFDPSLVQRTGIVTFTSEGIDRLDEDTMFMYVIPYKKRLIKRMVGKPGDSLYFYGGHIYGVDQEGKAIEELIGSPWMKNVEYIPFMDLSGEVVPKSSKEALITQNNQPIGKVTLTSSRELVGEIYDGKNWIKDDPQAQKTTHNSLKAYSDFFGIGNYAMARLLTKEQVLALSDSDISDFGEGVLYLELRHHPSLAFPKPLLLRDSRLSPILNPLRTIIPLQQSHLDALMDHMYTARIVFKDGKATRYSVDSPQFGSQSPTFAKVPDGTYEFYEGKLSSLGWGAIEYAASKDNPLYSRDPSNVQKLYNLGISTNNAYNPQGSQQLYFPSRYAYFRDGDLYLLGAPILKKDDPILAKFNVKELQREKNSPKDKPYIAFMDNGPPLKDGKYDVEKIRTFGLKVPEKNYYVLGDNHAMSSDSRAFGFLPEANLQGAPSLIIWPPGERLGPPPQKPYPLLTLPRLIVWAIAAASFLIWWVLHRRYLRRPIVIDKKD
ncbi:MAG: signal peptidase I [Parachlamydiaceae bacterium]|nr:signal peptidase I [Parachlamydiaceae bacterium]